MVLITALVLGTLVRTGARRARVDSEAIIDALTIVVVKRSHLLGTLIAAIVAATQRIRRIEGRGSRHVDWEPGEVRPTDCLLGGTSNPWVSPSPIAPAADARYAESVYQRHTGLIGRFNADDGYPVRRPTAGSPGWRDG